MLNGPHSFNVHEQFGVPFFSLSYVLFTDVKIALHLITVRRKNASMATTLKLISVFLIFHFKLDELLPGMIVTEKRQMLV